MTMAVPRGTLAANLYNLLPRGLQSSTLYAPRTSAVSWSSILPSTSITIPAITLNIPDIIADIWEGILRAVPKKKTSHMKKRHRQLAGKALKDVKSIVRCPACGKPKKAHTLCPYCVAEIKSMWPRPSNSSPRLRNASELRKPQRPEKVYYETPEEEEEDLDNEREIMDRRPSQPRSAQVETTDGRGVPKLHCEHCDMLISQRNMRRHTLAKHSNPDGKTSKSTDGRQRSEEMPPTLA